MERNKKHSKLDELKKEIRSVLLTYQGHVDLSEFLKTYRSLVGHRLPSRDLGFSSDVALLKSMPDVVDVQNDPHDKVFLSGIADKTSQHIQKLVSRQRKSKPNNNKCKPLNIRQPIRKLPSTLPNTRELKPFLPGSLRAEILELMSTCKCGLTLSSFALNYHRKFNKLLPLVKGLNTLEAMIKLIPELEIGKNENNETIIYNKKFLCNFGVEEGSSEKADSSSEMNNGKSAMQKESSSDIHESGISEDILKDFQMILQKCPDGIQNIHFPLLYENVTGKPFDVIELGYNSLSDLVEALPHIFKRVPNPDNEQCWLIYPSGSHVKQNFKAQNSPDNCLKQHFYHNRKGIPADVSSPTLQYIQSSIPSYINLNQYIPVFVSAIANPSLFWFQLQTDEFIEKFDNLEKDMENFYSNHGHKYQMHSADITIGATCVIQCPEDDNYYRAVIKSIPSTELINVSSVDFGSRNNVPINNLYYVQSKFHEYPSFAFKAQLADIKPAKNAESWSREARKKFVELCNCASLMALIKPISRDSYSVVLCDTTGEEDVFFHSVLINEGHAEICEQNQFDTKSSTSSDLENFSDGHNIPLDSDSSFISNQDKSHSDNSDTFFGSNELPNIGKLSISTDIENNVIHQNTSQFCQVTYSKRYIKQVEVCKDNSKIHLINLENKLFMSCDELCDLLWNKKDANLLIRRLMNKEININFLHIKKEDYYELFKQYLWYKIPGFEKKDSDNSSLILCSLEDAFNILNIFGHPSVCLRIIIQHELKIFDPYDEFWNEFSYDESSHLDDIEKDIVEEINKLCLYDLKAKSEIFSVKKLKLQRLQTDPTSKEIRRVENILNIIMQRIKEIETICIQYSSCS